MLHTLKEKFGEEISTVLAFTCMPLYMLNWTVPEQYEEFNHWRGLYKAAFQFRFIAATYLNHWFFEKPFIAVHIRRGDFLEACKSLAEKYHYPMVECWQTQEEVLEEVEKRKIIHNIEDVFVIYGAGAGSRNEEELEEFRRRGYKYIDWAEEELEYPGFDDLIVDQEIAAKSTVFIGNLHSGVSKTIYLQRCQESEEKCKNTYAFGNFGRWQLFDH